MTVLTIIIIILLIALALSAARIARLHLYLRETEEELARQQGATAMIRQDMQRQMNRTESERNKAVSAMERAIKQAERWQGVVSDVKKSVRSTSHRWMVDYYGNSFKVYFETHGVRVVAKETKDQEEARRLMKLLNG